MSLTSDGVPEPNHDFLDGALGLGPLRDELAGAGVATAIDGARRTNMTKDDSDWKVFKFGGSSLGTPEMLALTIDISTYRYEAPAAAARPQ